MALQYCITIKKFYLYRFYACPDIGKTQSQDDLPALEGYRSISMPWQQLERPT